MVEETYSAALCENMRKVYKEAVAKAKRNFKLKEMQLCKEIHALMDVKWCNPRAMYAFFHSTSTTAIVRTETRDKLRSFGNAVSVFFGTESNATATGGAAGGTAVGNATPAGGADGDRANEDGGDVVATAADGAGDNVKS